MARIFRCLLGLQLLITAFLSTLPASVLATSNSTNSTTHEPHAATTTPTVSATTTSIVQSTAAPSSSTAKQSVPITTHSISSTKDGNCSTCISSFRARYLNANLTSVSDHWIDTTECPPVFRATNDSCVSVVRENCSDVIGLLRALNSNSSNSSYGLACSANGLQVIQWADCLFGSPAAAKLINESNAIFCGMGNFSCSVDSNGIIKINKREIFEPIRKEKERSCPPLTTSKPTIPLLPNPVGPSAITAIVVLICLFIVGVLAGFFFWPKCHMSHPPPPTPKKRPSLTVEAINVAYSPDSPTGPASVAIVVPPGQQIARGPAAA